MCSEPDTYDYDCKVCNPECWTCSGSDTFECYSCDDPDYHFQDRATACPEACGDGKLFGHYQCDDGGIDDDDGCSHDCHYEPGFYCLPGTPYSPTVCTEVCGDGRHINHGCDDGNTIDGDGCDSTCEVEYGYTCHGGGRNVIDVCTETCGDGYNLGFYACDDGNTDTGDGCNDIC